jgi:NAD(P)H dehydrogenase (quinone)
MAPRILVTGATGTVGGAVIRELRDDHIAGRIDLRCATRTQKGADAIEKLGLNAVHFDYDNPSTLRPALEGVEGLFVVTGYTVDMMVHVKRLLDAAKSQNVSHIVHLGALAAVDTAFAHFAWHQLTERAIEAMGFKWTHLQPNFFIDTVWANFLRSPKKLVQFVGNQNVSWISSNDIAAVAAQSFRDPTTHTGKTYPLAVEAMTFGEVANLLSEITDRQVEYLPRPASELLPILLKHGMEEKYASSLASGVLATEEGKMPLVGEVYDSVQVVTGREPIGWRSFASSRLDELPPLP